MEEKPPDAPEGYSMESFGRANTSLDRGDAIFFIMMVVLGLYTAAVKYITSGWWL